MGTGLYVGGLNLLKYNGCPTRLVVGQKAPTVGRRFDLSVTTVESSPFDLIVLTKGRRRRG